MNVIFTCGGTAGHVNPALALAGFLRERDPKTRILFVGAERGLERDLIAHTPYPFRTVNISSFHRSLRPKELRHNLVSVRNLMHAKREADAILDEFQPDLIVGTGGYASYPVVRYGHARGIPTAVHESNAVPGLATRLVADRVDKILVSFEECRNAYRNRDRVEVVGMPVQEEFVFTKREDARRELGLGDEPLIVSAWGSLGAREMNRKIVDFMRLESKEKLWRHIHATGSFGWKWMPKYVKEQGIDLAANPQIVMQEYIYNMPTLMAAADLVISRAGASTLNEIAVAGTPCIIVPSPNDQEKNAAILAAHGAAVVLHENTCDGALLYRTAKELLADAPRREKMRRSLRKLAVLDSTQRIYQIITELAEAR